MSDPTKTNPHSPGRERPPGRRARQPRKGPADTIGDGPVDTSDPRWPTKPPRSRTGPCERLNSSSRIVVAAVLFIALKLLGLVLKFALNVAVLGFVGGLVLGRMLRRSR